MHTPVPGAVSAGRVLPLLRITALAALSACSGQGPFDYQDGGLPDAAGQTGGSGGADGGPGGQGGGTSDARVNDAGATPDMMMVTADAARLDAPPATPDMAPPSPDMMAQTPDMAPPTPDMAPPTPDMAPPTPDMAPAPPDMGGPWFSVDNAMKIVSTTDLSYRYAHAWLHGDMNLMKSFGVAVRGFKGPGAEEHSLGMDAIWLGDKWDPMEVAFQAVRPIGMDKLEIEVKTGSSLKIDRLYKGWPGMEIEYLDLTMVEELVDYITIDNMDMDDTTLVMEGMKDIVGRTAGQQIWGKSVELATAKYGIMFSTGDTFIEANGSTVEQCKYKDHLIYGAINPRSGRGVGFVWPAAVWDVKDMHFLFAEAERLEFWWLPKGKKGKRWMFPVTGGKEEVIRVGKSLVDNGGWKP